LSTVISNAVTALSGNLALAPEGTGVVTVDGLTFPSADGSANQVIKTNGSGVLSFTDAGGGLVLQAITMDTSNVDGSTTFPLDNTLPTSSEGTEIGSQAITLASSSSRVHIQARIHASAGGNCRGVSIALFRGTTCLQTSTSNVQVAGAETNVLVFNHIDSPSTSGAVTYSIRIGANPTSAEWNCGRECLAAKNYGDTLKDGATLLEYSS
jgi:hypothetical protein